MAEQLKYRPSFSDLLGQFPSNVIYGIFGGSGEGEDSDESPSDSQEKKKKKEKRKLTPFQEAWRDAEDAFYNNRESQLRGFDLTFPFYQYCRDLEDPELGRADALRRLEDTLQLNMKAFVQEGSGHREVMELATELSFREVFTADGLVQELFFRNFMQDDIEASDRRVIETTFNQDLRHRYAQENGAFYRDYRKHADKIIDLLDVDQHGTVAVIDQLRKRKFSRQKITLSESLKSLYPQLSGSASVEVYLSPEKIMTVSPSFYQYKEGKSTIARHSQLAFIPRVGKFVVLQNGLFTEYSDAEIAKFLEVGKEFWKAGQEQPIMKKDFKLPKEKQEFFDVLAVLSEEFAQMAPHAVFDHVITEMIGYFPDVSLGEGVISAKKVPLQKRDFSSQLKLALKVLEHEYQQCRENPELLKLLDKRLYVITTIIMQSLMRAERLSWREQFQNYLKSFRKDPGVGAERDALSADGIKRAQEMFFSSAVKINGDLATKVFSWIDCGTGTMINLGSGGMMGNMSIDGMFGLGTEGWLKAKIAGGFKNKDEFEKFCQKFGLDKKIFSKNVAGIQCRVCKVATDIMGSCSMCAPCNALYNMGKIGDLDMSEDAGKKKPDVIDFPRKKRAQKNTTVGIDVFVASFATPSVLAA